MEIQFRRLDGSFVASVNGLPYHVMADDPLFPLAEELGGEAPWEPMPTEPTEAELLAAERARMVLTRLQFARQAALAGKMTVAEARAWAGAGTDTALGTAALAMVPAGTARDQASIIFAAAQTIDRSNPLMPALQSVAEWTDAQVDEFFRAGMLL